MRIDRTGSVSTLQVRPITDQGNRGEIRQRERLLFLLLIRESQYLVMLLRKKNAISRTDGE
jgi:hypothetical protein